MPRSGIIVVLAALALTATGCSDPKGGTIGGKVSSSFKGKPGFEERLTEMTKYLGIGFFATSILVAVLASR